MREESSRSESATDAIWAPPPPQPQGREPQFAALGGARRNWSGRTTGVVLFVVLAASASYWGFLGWDNRRDLDPATGRLTGPYQPWQVIACGLIVLVLAAFGGWLREVERSSVAISSTLVVCFSITGVTDPMSDGLWGVGALMLAAVTFPGTYGIAAATRYVRNSINSLDT